MNAFITGSRVYGKIPTSETDIDLVIQCDEKTAELLRKLSDIGKEPVRYGKLNLILLTSEEEFASWLVANAGLKVKATKGPIGKELAAVTIDKVLALAGLPPRTEMS